MRILIICSVILLSVLFSIPAQAEWTTPVPVASGINTQYEEWTPFISSDGLSLYFSRFNSSGKIYEAKRNQPSGDFTSVNQVLSSYGHLVHPWVSPDNLRMYYHLEGSSSWNVMVSQRASVVDSWSTGSAVGGLPSGSCFPTFSADELTVVFNNPNVGNWDMYIATRNNKSSAFGNIRSLTELNTSSVDGSPSLSSDGLSLYFHSNRNGVQQIYEATRQSLTDSFGNLAHLSIFDNPNGTVWPCISNDGKAMYFSYGGANTDIYVSYNVPEPTTIALLGIGAMILRRKK
jgi:Tol biopolymer transport system component